MSELISGKKALIAIANGEEVQFCDNMGVWHNAAIHTHAIGLFLNDCYKFRLKPHTITLNGIEVPAPDYIVDTPHDYDGTWEINIDGTYLLYKSQKDYGVVVAALRSAFKA